MAVVNPPLGLQTSGIKHPASLVRRMVFALAGAEGVSSFNASGDLKVTPTGTPDNHVHVARGGALIQGDDSTDQGLYFCLDPDTRVLMSDLSYVPIAKVEVGDELVGIDEQTPGPKLHRKLRRSQVTRVGKRIAPRLRLRFNDGTEIITTTEHPWLTVKPQGPGEGRYRWVSTSDLLVGDQVKSIGAAWETDFSHDAGYLAGLYDGEGSINNGRNGQGGTAVSFVQKEGPVLERARSLLRSMDYSFGETIGHGGVVSLRVHGIKQMFRLLGAVRPQRLIENFKWDGLACSWKLPRVTLLSVEPLEPGEVVSITTTTSTFVAEGLLTHNCYNDADVALTVPAADVTNPRKDIVVARVKDTTEGQTGDTALLDYIAGTPAGVPSAPATPNTALLLATVDVPAGGTTVISAGNITDKRVARGGSDISRLLQVEMLSSASTVGLGTSEVTVYSFSSALPSGWGSMDIEVSGFVIDQYGNSSGFRRMSAEVKLDGATQPVVSATSFEDIAGSAVARPDDIPLYNFATNKTGAVTVAVTNWMTSGSTNVSAIGCLLVVRKYRRS